MREPRHRDVVRRGIRGRREDGTDLGGPGPTPQKTIPDRVWVDCPSCGQPCGLDMRAMVDKLWSSLPAGDGEGVLPAGVKRAFDEVQGPGWDLVCPACGEPCRLLYTLDEWGKMSASFAAVLTEALVLE